MSLAIISLSILLQFTAAGIAVRLIWITGRKWAWSLIAVAMVLMGVRRCVSLYRLVSSDGVVTTDFSAELIALTISFLMFAGVVLIGALFSDIRKAGKALKESEERFRVFIDNVPALVSLKDMEGRYIFINEAYRKNFGMSQADCEGKGTAALFPGAIAEDFASQERRVIETMAPVTQEHEVPHSDGMHIHLCTKFPVLDTQGKVASVGTISTDITDRIQAEDDRNVALVNAEEANQAKSEFLATMSHEFRTPLNAILGFADILSNQYFGPIGERKYLEYATDIHDSGKYLLELVNDLLDISTIEAGKQNLQKEPVSIDALIEDCIHIVSEQAKQKNIAFINDAQSGLSSINGDSRAVKQILLNLFSNAVKFTHESGQVTVSTLSVNGHVVVNIVDTGIGIDPQRIPYLTDPFVRADQDPYLSNQGTGLGLTITKSLIDLHDGTLEIASDPGQGTTVTVTLPIG
jgi:PAS domain S-box-containing protein